MKYQPPFLPGFTSAGGIYNPNANAGYVNGNPQTGVEGSYPPAEAIEHPLREIMAVIQDAGLTPSATDLTQLLQALRRMTQRAGVPQNIFYVETSGTYTKPAALAFLRVRGIGGGAGGGGSNTSSWGGGGGNGGYFEAWFLADAIAATEAYTVGAGGAGVSAGVAAAGANGGATTFKGITALGGGGGGSGPSGGNFGEGGTVSGVPAGKGFSVQGMRGYPGLYTGIVTPTPFVLYGRGGSSGQAAATSVPGANGVLEFAEYFR
jgi:hypothetical protein